MRGVTHIKSFINFFSSFFIATDLYNDEYVSEGTHKVYFYDIHK
jgi:hypothetical protein